MPDGIRLARRDDAAAIATLSRTEIEHGLSWRWRPGRVQAMLSRKDATVIVQESSGVLTGFAIMTFGQEHAHLHLLAVKPAERERGVARGLVEWLMTSCRVAGIGRVDLEVRRNNTGAIRFYEKLGFEKAGIIRGLVTDGGDQSVLGYRGWAHLLALSNLVGPGRIGTRA